MSNNNIVEGWLRSINLVQYAQSFIDNGYDDLEVCKQIGELDVDAIGIVTKEHREKLLRAVRVLREEGGTAVYFTLEETTRKPLTKTTSLSAAIDTRPNYLNIRECQDPLPTQQTDIPGLFNLLEDQTDKRDEYDVGKITLISYPKFQLNQILQLKLEDDGIVFSNPPYTTQESELCLSSLTALAVKYADELNTHCDDVSQQLQELWQDAMKLDCYPVTTDRSLGHGFYGSSTLYGFSPRNMPPPIPSIPPPNTSHVEKCTDFECNLQMLEHRLENQQNTLNISRDGESTIDTKKKTSTINRFLRNIGIRKSGKKHSYKKHSGDPNAGDITMNDDERIALMVMVKEGKISTETALEVVRRFEDKRVHNFNSSSGQFEGKENVAGQNNTNKQNLSIKPMKSHSAIYADVGPKCHICQRVLTLGEEEDSRFNHYSQESENLYICCRHKRVHSVGHIDLSKTEQRPLFTRAISQTHSRSTNSNKAHNKPSDGRKDTQLYSPVLMSSFKSMQPTLPQAMETIKEKRSGKSKDFMHKTTSRTSLLSSESEHSVESSQQALLRCKEHSKYDELKTYCCNSTFSLSSEKTSDQTSAAENDEQKCQKAMGYMTGDDVYSETDEHDNTHLLGPLNKGNRNKLGGCLREMRVELKKKVLKYKEDKAQTLPVVTTLKGCSKNGVDDKHCSGRASPRTHIVPAPSYYGRSPNYRCSQTSLSSGHYVERVRVIHSYKPDKEEKDFLHIEKGDWINVLCKDMCGIWRGVLKGVVGNFYCANVVQHGGPSTTRKEMKQYDRPGTVEEMLQMIGLEHLSTLFLENGFDQLEIFYEINDDDLNVLNINNPDHRHKLLTAAKMYGRYGSETWKCDYGSGDCIYPGQSITCRPEASKQLYGDKTDKEYSEEDKEVSALTNYSGKSRTYDMSPASPIYLTSKSHFYGYRHCCDCRQRPEMLSTDNFCVADNNSTLPNQSFYEQLAPQSLYGKHKKVKPVPPPRISSAQGLSFENQKMNDQKADIQSGKHASHSDGTLSDSSSLQGGVSSSAGNTGSRKDVTKVVEPIYAASRKTLKNISRSLIPLVTTKLGAERIDFSLEPYSTQNGHCGIPPLLVQRYAEELRQDITSVALVLEQVRIIQLQSLDRICVPNEKLAESCSEACDLKIASVKEFFISVGLPMYIEDVIESGVESIDQLLKMTESQLNTLTGADSRHLKRLMHAIEWVSSKLSSHTHQAKNLPFINVIDKV